MCLGGFRSCKPEIFAGFHHLFICGGHKYGARAQMWCGYELATWRGSVHARTPPRWGTRPQLAVDQAGGLDYLYYD